MSRQDCIIGKTCKRGFEVQVMRSAAGYYLGTRTEIGEPFCRLTSYASTPEEAEALGVSRGDSLEIISCSDGYCFEE